MLEIVGILTLMIGILTLMISKSSKVLGILNKFIKKSFSDYFIICYQINHYVKLMILFQNKSNLN